MNRLQTYSLATIALVLISKMAINDVWPALYASLYGEKFVAVSVECLSAKSAASTTSALQEAELFQLAQRLTLARQTQLVKCHEYEKIKAQFLSHGVCPSKIKRLELEAAESKDLRLDVLVEAYYDR